MHYIKVALPTCNSSHCVTHPNFEIKGTTMNNKSNDNDGVLESICLTFTGRFFRLWKRGGGGDDVVVESNNVVGVCWNNRNWITISVLIAFRQSWCRQTSSQYQNHVVLILLWRSVIVIVCACLICDEFDFKRYFLVFFRHSVTNFCFCCQFHQKYFSN